MTIMQVLDTSQFVSERMKIRPVTNAELDQIKQNMNTSKYELTNETIKTSDGRTLCRIKALRDIPLMNVKEGDLGGWIESYDNLDQEGDCWVADYAYVYDNARVYGDAKVYGSAEVHGNAEVYGDAYVYNYANVHDNAKVYGISRVCGDAEVYGDAEIHGTVKIYYDVKDRNIDR